MWMIPLPLRVPVSKRRMVSLNLNIYRNLHYQTLNKAKQNFAAQVRPLLGQVPALAYCYLHYVVYPASRQLLDISNIGAIVDKFFSDTLVEAGILTDDNYQIVRGASYALGQIDRQNPRVEAFIYQTDPFPLNSKETDVMQIILKKEDLDALVLEHVTEYMNPAFLADKSVDLIFTDDGEVLVEFVSEGVDTAAKTRDSEKKPTARRATKTNETRSTPPPAETRPPVSQKTDEAATAKSAPAAAAVEADDTAPDTDAVTETAKGDTKDKDKTEAPPAFKSLFGHLSKPENK